MKIRINPLLTLILASGALALPLCAQTTPSEGGSAAAVSPSAAPSPAKTHFGGTVSAVDATAKTITVDNKRDGSRTFQLTDSTKVSAGGKDTATLDDVKVGDHVHGAFQKSGDGKMELETLKVGPAGHKGHAAATP